MQTIADIRYSSAVLQWDQETYLPPKGAAFRGRQIATLAGLAHSMFTEEKFGSLLVTLDKSNDIEALQLKNVQLTLEDYSRQKKLSSEFVTKLTETINRSFHKWIEARRENRFEIFAPVLSELVELKRREADMLGYADHPYDALLNEFDRGSTVKQIDRVFEEILPSLKDLLERILARPQAEDKFLKQAFDSKQQWAFGMQLLKDLGFDFEAGRQDLSEHPFTTNFNSRDVRITTRIDEADLSNMTWSCIHELGHALYEQGLPEEQYGLPLGEPASLSVHESQSRLWENHIGRSLAFCEKYLPLIKEHFPGKLDNIGAEQFYAAINKVQPSLIRTEADELTYHFHVMIRYELEKKLIGGSLETRDIPAFWNERYKFLLGVDVPDDKRGCLQDVHWSHGSFGYFPTYSLGSFYAAQFYRIAGGDNNSYDPESVLRWLRKNVHAHGRRYTSEELCREITGESLDTRYFLEYLLDKYRKIYNF